MRIVNTKQITELQKRTKNIRNICIVAHVDHGKTTLADSLVASNGIISQKMAGKLRYMDSRQDEQERGITMKSSSIALYYSDKSSEWLINLIDSPGHVDFSSEVSTAVCLCDGAIILIDVVEGVCAQTRVALQQAWGEGLKPVLVLNKIDRLIVERELSPLDAYVHLSQVLEQANALMGEMFATDVMARGDKQEQSKIPTFENDLYDWSSGLEDADDSNLYFSPETGNVLFASATDGWAFGVQEFAKVYSEKLGVKKEQLQKVLWGDFYLDTKTKRFKKGAQEHAKKPLFVKFVLDNIWALYDTILIRKDKAKIPIITEKLGIKLTARDMRHTDPKVQLQAICSQWLPLADAVLKMVCENVPSPKGISEERVERLMSSKSERFDSLLPQTQAHKEDFLACDNSNERPVILFISKMFSVDKHMLPKNKLQPLTEEDICKRRELARARHAERMAKSVNLNTDIANTIESIANLQTSLEIDEEESQLEDIFIAFARIFSGTLKKGQEVYVLGPKYDPRAIQSEEIDPQLTLRDLKAGQHVTKTVIKNIYLLMGRELEEIEVAPCGNIIGIGGLEDHVLKTATLSTSLYCPSFSEVLHIDPIVRVAVEPANPNDMAALIKGLKLLNQADACVQILLQGSGEHVLATAGEVHLERCLEDLKLRYAKVAINVSDPIVPFRETIVAPPLTDMVNEAIQEQNKQSNNEQETETMIEIFTSNKQSCITMTAVPLPEKIVDILEQHAQLLKSIDRHSNVNIVKENSSDKTEIHLTERTMKAIANLKDSLAKAFHESGDTFTDFVEKIWSCGPRKCGTNLLINNTSDYKRASFWSLIDGKNSDQSLISKQDRRSEYDSSFINGFQLATLAGPLCEEPMQGVCFIINKWSFSENDVGSASQPYGPVSGQIMSCVKEGCRKAFIARPQRLVAAMYSSSILVNGEVLGKLYAVLGRRHGRILSGDMTQGSGNFDVTAVLPVVESFRFAQEIRKQTSGLASPQLMFSHWEIIEIDPYWAPSTEEEYLHFGEKADSGNRARRYVDAVRKRKGLAVEEKLVEFAEKQRTLSKKK